MDDDYHLPPHEQRERHTLLTSAESDHVTQIITSTERPAQVSDDGPLPVRRSDHLRMEQRIVEVPASERTRDMGEMGVFQVIKAEVTSGTWSETVAVPFSQYAYSMGWDGGYVTLPGTDTTLQLQLGKTLHPMPVRVTLEEFELVPYPGGDINVGIPRDFKSTLIIEERGGGGQPYTDVAHMNSPVYVSDQYGHSWLLFQAAWDPEGQAWTVLGVGNRPAVGIMTLGGTMILVGLLYAFYAKPIIIRKMKESALRQAAERNASSRAAPARQPAEQPLPAPMMSARTSEPT